MFQWSMINVKVTVVVFKCLNSTIPLICALANEYPSSDRISKNGPCEGIKSLAMPCYTLGYVVSQRLRSVFFYLCTPILNYNEDIAMAFSRA